MYLMGPRCGKMYVNVFNASFTLRAILFLIKTFSWLVIHYKRFQNENALFLERGIVITIILTNVILDDFEIKTEPSLS